VIIDPINLRKNVEKPWSSARENIELVSMAENGFRVCIILKSNIGEILDLVMLMR
jgi:hypothetical protein